MQSKRLLLWDLDGTLTDPKPGITRAVRHALHAFGIEETDSQKLCAFIGPPLKDSFMAYYGFSPEEADKAVTVYREYFAEKGLFENRVYSGIAPLLRSLADKGRTHVLATSKPTVFAQRILEHFDLAPSFAFIAGSNLDGTRVKKAEVIAYALEGLGTPPLASAVMIGDRHYDILGARELGLDAIGVAYGYGTRRELIEAGASAVAGTVEELGRLLA